MTVWHLYPSSASVISFASLVSMEQRYNQKTSKKSHEDVSGHMEISQHTVQT